MSDIDPSTLSPDALQAHLDAVQASADAAQASANARQAAELQMISQALIAAQTAQMKANEDALLVHAAAARITVREMAAQIMTGWAPSTLAKDPAKYAKLAVTLAQGIESLTPATPNGNPNAQ